MIARRENHYWRLDIPLAQLGANLHRIESRPGVVDDDEIKIVGKSGISREFKI